MRLDLDAALRQLRPERPPVLLLGGLDLLRPLGFAGIPTILATPYPRDPALGSRYCLGGCQLPPLENREAMAETLLAAGVRLASALGRRIPLFYGNDDYLNLISAFRNDLRRYFLLTLNEPDITRQLLEKDSFEALARDRGIAVPKTLIWDDKDPCALRHAVGPVIVKPKVKMGWELSPIHLRLFGGEGKARIFENGSQVMEDPLAIRLKDQLTFQEYIPGGDRQLWSFHGVTDEKGALLAWFIGRKLRTFPALTGMSTYLELAHDETLAAMGRDIVARVPLKGVFKIDFKKDAINGRFYVLEINARYNLWHHVAARNGINLPQVAYDYLVDGTRPENTSYRTTFRWLCFRLDFRAYRELSARAELSFIGWLLSLFASFKIYHLFSWTDPVPFLLAMGDRANVWLRRRLDHLRSRLQRWLSTAL